jgi:hypothetical protein
MNTIKWIGTAASIAGAFTLAGGAIIAGYSLFLIGSISWICAGVLSKDNPIIVLNMAFFLANVLGFVNNW